MSGEVYKPLTFRRCFKRGWFFKLRLYSDSSAVRLSDLWFLGFSLKSWLKDFWGVFFPYCKAKLALTSGQSVDLKLRVAPRGWFKYMFIEWDSLRALQCHVLHPSVHPPALGFRFCISPFFVDSDHLGSALRFFKPSILWWFRVP